ncbi:hypothetical protein Ani05nite_27920 [Amorphoplanes nipponensis]|uniref:Uncharacterized protein n=1 Tax=Actinoplanes nipponensis TaxID=135950 RepID=A0A919JEK0_9ACTN|nr:hypothetical protein Ani05nite_27920 [Actinoplanes nipponensis]
MATATPPPFAAVPGEVRDGLPDPGPVVGQHRRAVAARRLVPDEHHWPAGPPGNPHIAGCRPDGDIQGIEERL